MPSATVLQSPSSQERAQAVWDQLTLLAASRAEQVFRRGELLLECERDGLPALLGYQTQEAFLEALGVRRSTALSDKRIASVFDREKHAHIGASKLRALVHRGIPDPRALIEAGLEVEAEDGRVTRIPVEQLSYRQVCAAINRLTRLAPVVAPALQEALTALNLEPEGPAEARPAIVSMPSAPASVKGSSLGPLFDGADAPPALPPAALTKAVG